MIKGKDKFGRFTVVADYCALCQEIGPTVHYAKTLKLPADIDLEATILKGGARCLGIVCGCYAKFHRQVAHIETTKKFKEAQHEAVSS